MEQRIRELEARLNSFNRTSPTPQGTATTEMSRNSVSIDGFWQTPPFSVVVRQLGGLVNIGFYAPTGLLTSVCQGSYMANTLQVNCSNGVMWAYYTGTLTAEARRIDFVTYARGFQEQFSIVR
jgi:hypothetical protein